MFDEELRDLPQHILIVDDDPVLLKALPGTISLRLPGVQVDVAISAQQALEYIQRQRYDAIVSDINMPDMDGLALLARSRELQPETPTLLITGHGDHNLAIQALRGGAYDYILKPIDRDEFIAALSRAMQTCQLRRRVEAQQWALEQHARSLGLLVEQRTQELVEAHAVKDKVISLVSSELNGPIAHLREMTLLLRQKLGVTEETEIVSRGFADIEQSLVRTEELVQELVATSGIETQMFIQHSQCYDLIELCQRVLEEETADADVTLSYERLGRAVHAMVDRDQIRRVLHSLLSLTELVTVKGAQTKIVLQRTGHEALIVLRDHGERTSIGGGFYVARKIVESHGGHLEIQNFPENRRSLFITLPLQESESAESVDATTFLPRTHAVWTIASKAGNKHVGA